MSKSVFFCSLVFTSISLVKEWGKKISIDGVQSEDIFFVCFFFVFLYGHKRCPGSGLRLQSFTTGYYHDYGRLWLSPAGVIGSSFYAYSHLQKIPILSPRTPRVSPDPVYANSHLPDIQLVPLINDNFGWEELKNSITLSKKLTRQFWAYFTLN